MTRRVGTGNSGGGYDYVQDSEPAAPEEGEEWYDTGANAAYVYDGSVWIEETVVDHTQLSGVGPDNHHSRYANSEAINAVGDAAQTETGSFSTTSGAGTVTVSLTGDYNAPLAVDVTATDNAPVDCGVTGFVRDGELITGLEIGYVNDYGTVHHSWLFVGLPLVAE